MKKFSLLFRVILLIHLGQTHLRAQSLADLNGVSWKPRLVSFDALSDAQSDESVVSALALAPMGQTRLKFREVAFNNVRDLLETGRETSVSIVEGYEMAQAFMGAEPLFEQIDKAERKKTFDELVNVLKN